MKVNSRYSVLAIEIRGERMTDWFWTRRFHSLTIGGNGGALVMLAGFISTYDDPFLKLKGFGLVMILFLSGLVYAALGAYIGMVKEYHLWEAAHNRDQLRSNKSSIMELEETSEQMVQANRRVKKLLGVKTDMNQGQNTFSKMSGGLFLAGCVLLFIQLLIIPYLKEFLQ